MHLISPVFPHNSVLTFTQEGVRVPYLINKMQRKRLSVLNKRLTQSPFHFRCKNKDVCALDFFSFFNMPPSFCLAHLLALLPGSKAVKKNRGKPPEYQLTAATDVKS